MRFFKSLKGNAPNNIGSSSAQNTAHHARAHDESLEEYKPPTGPPPPGSHEKYHPPPGPPPSHIAQNQTAHGNPPPFSDLDNGENPPPYHDWTSVPDTALLPPPPALGHQASPSSNAPLDAALRAHQFCYQYPLIGPHMPTGAHIDSVRRGTVDLIKPQEYRGNLSKTHNGAWVGHSPPGSKDSCLLTSLPLYFATTDSPFHTEATKVIYFEVKIISFGRGRDADESSLALGFCAAPYPTWRMPGWERGSLAVHTDDGRRYVNDTDGGKDFVAPIQAGETVGIGITYAIPDTPPNFQTPVGGRSSLKTEVFFTRSGRRVDGWNLHEELDAESEFGVLGLDGSFDLYGAIGIFGGVEFEVTFNSQGWLWRPA